MTTWLIDNSAFARLHRAPNAAEWASRIDRGLVRICSVTKLELGVSARSGAHHRVLLTEPPVSAMPVVYLTPHMENRALEVQAALAERGQHRAPAAPDLIVAATAELAKLTVLHVDKDFELIAEVTGQPVERLELA